MTPKEYRVAHPHTNSYLLEKTYSKTLSQVYETLKRLEKGLITFDYGGRPIRAVPADIIRVISQIETNDDLSLCYKNLVLNALISLELSAAFSGSNFLECIANKAGQKKKRYRLRASEKEMYDLVRKNIGSGLCFDVFKEIHEKGSIFSKLEFITSNDTKNFKIVVEGNKSIQSKLHMLFENSVKKLEDCHVLFVDGIIEKVSEIHRILEESEGVNIALFAHGFSADVVHTLSENFKSQKLSVLPFVVEDKENSWKFFNEIGVFSIRRENYLAIQTTKIEDLTFVKKLRIDSGSCAFSGHYSEETSTLVLIPGRLKNQAAVIEERIKSSIQYAQDISKFGVTVDENNKATHGRSQYQKSSKAVKSFVDLIQNMGCVVTHSV